LDNEVDKVKRTFDKRGYNVKHYEIEMKLSKAPGLIEGVFKIY